MSTDLTVRGETVEFMPALTLEQAHRRYDEMAHFVRSQLKEGLDYGRIPGGNKPTLLKPGAEKLCAFFGLHIPRPVVLEGVKDWTGADHGGEPFFYYEITQELTRNGQVVAAALASCSSWESKYRYRKGERLCPKCGKPAIIKGKAEYGGGWICFDKKGGCKAKFRDGDAAIESQAVGRVANPDVFDQVNTVQKMAHKRAFIGAVLLATNASEFFTQDLEDLVDGEIIEGPVVAHPVQKPNGNGHHQEPPATPPAAQPDAQTSATLRKDILKKIIPAIDLPEDALTAQLRDDWATYWKLTIKVALPLMTDGDQAEVRAKWGKLYARLWPVTKEETAVKAN